LIILIKILRRLLEKKDVLIFSFFNIPKKIAWICLDNSTLIFTYVKVIALLLILIILSLSIISFIIALSVIALLIVFYKLFDFFYYKKIAVIKDTTEFQAAESNLNNFNLNEIQLKKIEEELRNNSFAPLNIIDTKGCYIFLKDDGYYNFNNKIIPGFIKTDKGIFAVFKKKFLKFDSRFYKEIIGHKITSSFKCVPSIIKIDFKNREIFIEAVNGRRLFSFLKSEKNKNPDRNNRYILNEFINNTLEKDSLKNLKEVLEAFHKKFICYNDVHLKNILFDEKRLYLIDFSSISKPLSEIKFQHHRTRDIEKFNSKLFQNEFSYRVVGEKIREYFKSKEEYLGWYETVDFGCGFYVPGTGTKENGINKYNYLLKGIINRQKGLKILDLGANCGIHSLMAVKNNAAKAVSFEKSQYYFNQALFVKKALEWKDQKEYNVTLINRKIEDLPGLDLGCFDVVLALNVLYYLNEQDLTKILSHLRNITKKLLVQCNHSYFFSSDDTNLKATVDYMKKQLSGTGYKIEKIISPFFYRRPLIIAGT